MTCTTLNKEYSWILDEKLELDNLNKKEIFSQVEIFFGPVYLSVSLPPFIHPSVRSSVCLLHVGPSVSLNFSSQYI